MEDKRIKEIFNGAEEMIKVALDLEINAISADTISFPTGTVGPTGDSGVFKPIPSGEYYGYKWTNTPFDKFRYVTFRPIDR